jgi:hypothetical protein
MPYIGTFAAAKIQYSGQVYDLWQSQVSGAFEPAARENGIGPWVNNVTLQITSSTTCQVSVSIEAPYKEGIKLLESGLFTQGNILAVRLGYSKSGFMTPWYSGIMAAPTVTLGTGGLSATLMAQGAGAESLIMGSGKTWGPCTRWKVIQEIADKYKWVIMDPDGACEFQLDAWEWYNHSQAGEVDWMFIKNMLSEQGIDCAGVVDPESGKAALKLSLRSATFGSQPQRTFVAMGEFDLSKNQYPVFGFSSVSEPGMIFSSGAMKGVRLLSVDENGDEQDDSATVDDLPDQSLGLWSMDQTGDATEIDWDTGLPNSTPPNSGGDDEGSGVILADSPTETGSDFVHSALQEGQMGMVGAEVSINVPGVPAMQVYELFELKGVSALFNGKYMSKSVTHVVGTGGFETTIVGVRNALGLSQKATTNQNTTDPVEDGEAESE